MKRILIFLAALAVASTCFAGIPLSAPPSPLYVTNRSADGLLSAVGIRATGIAPSPASSSGFLAVGDSLTAYGSTGQHWFDILQAAGNPWWRSLAFSTNVAIGGVSLSSATGVTNQWATWKAALCTNANRYCSVWVGANDIGGSVTAWIGTYSNMLQEMTWSNVHPICVTVMPRADFGLDSSAAWLWVWTANDWLRQTPLAWRVVDAERMFPNCYDLKWFSDRTHLLPVAQTNIGGAIHSAVFGVDMRPGRSSVMTYGTNSVTISPGATNLAAAVALSSAQGAVVFNTDVYLAAGKNFYGALGGASNYQSVVYYPTNDGAVGWWVASDYSVNGSAPTLVDRATGQNFTNTSNTGLTLTSADASLNNRPTLTLGNNAALYTPSVSVTNPATWIAVIKMTGNNGSFDNLISDAASQHMLWQLFANGMAGFTLNPNGSVSASGLGTNTWVIAEVLWNGSQSRIYTNGTLAQSVSAAAYTNLTDTGWKLSGSARNFVIAEMLEFTKALTSAERSRVVNYLQTEFALTNAASLNVVNLSASGTITGNGSGLTNLSVSGIAATGAHDNTTALFGDGTWKAVSTGSGIDAATGTNIAAFQAAMVGTNATNYANYAATMQAAAAQAASLPLHAKADTAGTADTALAGWPTTWSATSIYGTLSLTNIGSTNFQGFFSGGGYFTNLTVTNFNAGTVTCTQLGTSFASKPLATDANSNVVAAAFSDLNALASGAILTNGNAAGVQLAGGLLTTVVTNSGWFLSASTNAYRPTWDVGAVPRFFLSTNAAFTLSVTGLTGTGTNWQDGEFYITNSSGAASPFAITLQTGINCWVTGGVATAFAVTNSAWGSLRYHGSTNLCVIVR